MSYKIQLRTHYPEARPTLVYLPGMHGDWTLNAGFRQALRGRMRFVEIAYPNTVAWSLPDHAAAVAAALLTEGITAGWLLAESFGSQVAWALTTSQEFNVQGLVLAGGFVRHPMPRTVRCAERCCRRIPLSVVRRSMRLYAKVLPWRFRSCPGSLEAFHGYAARLTETGRLAAMHRLRLIAENDPRQIARDIRVPVYALAGLLDPIVPWVPVRNWLERYCPAFRDWRLILAADHKVLGTAPETAATQVLEWVSREPAIVLGR